MINIKIYVDLIPRLWVQSRGVAFAFRTGCTLRKGRPLMWVGMPPYDLNFNLRLIWVFFYNTSYWGGAIFAPPLPLVSETTDPICKFQAALEMSVRFVVGNEI